MRTLYVKSESKAQANRDLNAGYTLAGIEYDIIGAKPHFLSKDNGVENGTVIKIYSQMSGRNPIAKAYGQWKNGKIK